MDSLTNLLPSSKKFEEYINDVRKYENPIVLSGLIDPAKIHFSYATHFYIQKPILIVTYNEIKARKIIKDMKFFDREVLYFPKKENIIFDYFSESKENLHERIEVLSKIYSNKAPIVVTTVEACIQKMIPKNKLFDRNITFKEGNIYNVETIKENLVDLRI